MIRFAISIVSAGFIVFGFFWLLQNMLKISAAPLTIEEQLHTLDLIQLKKEPPSPPKKRSKPQIPKPLKELSKRKVKIKKKRIVNTKKLIQPKQFTPQKPTLQPKIQTNSIKQQNFAPQKQMYVPNISSDADIAFLDATSFGENLGLPSMKLSAVSALEDALVEPPPKKQILVNPAPPRKPKLSTHLVPLTQINPIYPRRARMMKKEGYVKLEFLITTTGEVKEVKVIDSQPKGLFDMAAKKALLRWKFAPKVENGQPVEQLAVVQIDFQLKQ